MKGGHKVMGYFAYTSQGNVFCDGDACIIAGSKELMKEYLDEMKGLGGTPIIKKTRFSEIAEGVVRGAVYIFDQISFERLSPLIQYLEIDCQVSSENVKLNKENFYRLSL